MLEFIGSLFGAICDILAGILPDSPFADLAFQSHAVVTGVGWLNWVFPVGDCLALMTIWLAAIVIVHGSKFVSKMIDRVTSGVMGQS